jgi:hypothetical protein
MKNLSKLKFGKIILAHDMRGTYVKRKLEKQRKKKEKQRETTSTL